ncbi:hypothetical protein [Acidithiobacillus sp.]
MRSCFQRMRSTSPSSTLTFLPTSKLSKVGSSMSTSVISSSSSSPT